MLLRRGFPDMPTTTVVLELISRTGSPTKYSLSPYQGMRKIIGEKRYGALAQSEKVEELVAWKDDFTFSHDDFKYTVYDQDVDLRDMGIIEDDDFNSKYPEAIDPEEVGVYHITDAFGPEYVRRFEDSIPAENMSTFIRHVLSNVMNNNDGWKAWKEKHQVGVMVHFNDDDEEFNECEMQTEGDSGEISDSAVIQAKHDLAYCLYRMNRLSRRCGVNILSLVYAYRKIANQLKSRIPDKPAALINNGGPVYYANKDGDCTTPITNPADRALTSARNILIKDGGGVWVEFAEDFKKLQHCLTVLSVDVRNDDPRKYTFKFIKSISDKILVDNYTYVTRKNGGYTKEILKSLKKVSLDLVQNTSVEQKFDPLATAVNLIVDSADTPSEVYRAFNRTAPSSNPSLALSMIPLMRKQEFMPIISAPIGDGDLSGDGFLLDITGEYFCFKGNIFIPQTWGLCTTGRVYIHNSGYAVFEPLTDVVLLASVSSIQYALELEDWEGLQFTTIGPGAARLR